MSVEAHHLISTNRRGIDICMRDSCLQPGSALLLGRLHPSRVIATCEVKNKEGTIIARDPDNIVIEFHQSEDDKIGTIIDTEGLSIAIVSFSKEQYVVLYRRQKNIRRKIELFHIDDDFETDKDNPYVDDRMSI